MKYNLFPSIIKWKIRFVDQTVNLILFDLEIHLQTFFYENWRVANIFIYYRMFQKSCQIGSKFKVQSDHQRMLRSTVLLYPHYNGRAATPLDEWCLLFSHQTQKYSFCLLCSYYTYSLFNSKRSLKSTT